MNITPGFRNKLISYQNCMFLIKYLHVILNHVKMVVNVQMLEILPSSVNVLLVTAENDVKIKV